jgi:hypothetical protein
MVDGDSFKAVPFAICSRQMVRLQTAPSSFNDPLNPGSLKAAVCKFFITQFKDIRLTRWGGIKRDSLAVTSRITKSTLGYPKETFHA